MRDMHARNKYSSPMYEGDKPQFQAVSIPKRVEPQGKVVHGMQVHKQDKEPSGSKQCSRS